MKKYFFNRRHSYYLAHLLALLLVFMLIQKRQGRIDNFNCEICADKAGYYMYLPALFYSGFQAENYPEGFDELHGKGFYVEEGNDFIITKFTSGVALLQLPFYGTGVLLNEVFRLHKNPWSDYFLFFIYLGAAAYLVLGLFFLRKWLENYVSRRTALLSALIVFFGTNLYYYTLDESLMTHMYGFTLFAIVLYSQHKCIKTKSVRSFLLYALALAIAILLRPTNILFAVLAFLTVSNNWKDFRTNLLHMLQWKHLLIGLIVLFLILLPQMIYWKAVYGKFISWSYQGEGFHFWKNPQLATVWFSPQSGVFPYTPLVLLMLAGAVMMWLKHQQNGLLVFLAFLLVSYMCASWSNPYFGICNFGKRPLVEYYPLLILPVAWLWNQWEFYNLRKKVLLAGLTALFVIYNLLLFNAFNTCFFGQAWDMESFFSLLHKAFLFQ